MSFLKTKKGVLNTCTIAIDNNQWHLLSVLRHNDFFLFLVTEELSNEKQRDIEEHQKIITLLTLQVRDKDKENETLKQRLKGN